MKKDLNPEQLQAVQWVQGPLLVLAGAGSGKTRVIEYRSIFLVEEMNVPPSRILLLTFTRKAAYEMIQRAARHSPDCQRIQGGTFHSFAYNMLRQYGSHLGLPRFTLLDRSDSEDVLELSIQELGFRKKKERFPKKETVLQIFQLALSRRKSIEDVLKESYPQFLNLEEELEKLRQHFTQYKLEKSYVDYDDLLVYLHLLLEDESLGNKIRSHYSYIMVDEYQDTNYLQGRITYLLGK
ncbi:MAG: ATP-dependent helicase, partial [Planctomycetota bacterium]